ncbi:MULTISPECIES: hypothetical protein [Kribbella]|nr:MULTISPECIES: hypothetical protein [Kribbella]
MIMLGYLQQLGAHFGAWLYFIASGLLFAEAALLVGWTRLLASSTRDRTHTTRCSDSS